MTSWSEFDISRLENSIITVRDMRALGHSFFVILVVTTKIEKSYLQFYPRTFKCFIIVYFPEFDFVHALINGEDAHD